MFGDNSVDAVIVTLVLCSVEDVPKVLSEVKRVLKPGGKFYFFEHVLDPNPGSFLGKMQVRSFSRFANRKKKNVGSWHAIITH